MIYCEKCGWQPVDEKDLPVMLPDIEKFEDILPDGSGKGPLAKHDSFVNTHCPKCGGEAKRETDVMDPFVDSSWYFLRYPSAEIEDKPFDETRMKKWLPVEMYIGGKEHTVLHLLYARFITMAPKDFGFIDFEEPFERFFGHGLLIKEGKKMSKSKGNVINPDEYIQKYGADSVRMYLMFLGDFSQGGDWRDTGMKGMYKFIKRVWTLRQGIAKDGPGITDVSMIDKTVAGVQKDIERLSYNTAIAKIMQFVNWYIANEDNMSAKQKKVAYEHLCLIMAPFAPFITEELWSQLGNSFSIHQQKWPTYDEDLARGEEVEMAVQINGKTRDTITLPRGTTQEQTEKIAQGSSRVSKYLTEKPKKVIFVQDRIINFVV